VQQPQMIREVKAEE